MVNLYIFGIYLIVVVYWFSKINLKNNMVGVERAQKHEL